MKFSIKKRILEIVNIGIMSALFFLLMNKLGFMDKGIIMTIVVIGCGSLGALAVIKKIAFTRLEGIIVCMGYFLRIICLYINVNLANPKSLLKNSDEFGFWSHAVELYRGLPTWEYTKYPYIIRFLMNFFGENNIIIQYCNILIWVIAVYIMYQCFQKLNITGNSRLLGIVLFSLLPQYMLLTAGLMRESIIICLHVFSLYFFLNWYERGYLKDFFLAECMILFSMILHSGAVGIGAAYGIGYAFFNTKKKKFCISLKTYVIIVILIAGLLCMYYIPSLKRIFMGYMPRINSIYQLQDKWFDNGGSDYLRNLPRTSNLFTFALYTVLRMLYFYISPVPLDWRGIGDVIAFFLDSIVHLIIVGAGCIQCFKKKSKPIVKLAFLCIITTGLVFSFAISNAGAAMRHRSKLIGFEIVLLCTVVSERKKETKALGR